MDNLKSFIIFLSAVLLIYGGTNYYIYRSLMRAASLSGASYWLLKIVFLLLVLAYPLGRTFGGQNLWGAPFVWVGSIYMAVMVYALMFAVLFDVLRLSDKLIGWYPNVVINDSIKSGRIALLFSIVVTMCLITYGHINTYFPKVKHLKLTFEHYKPPLGELKIAVISDLHIGTINGPKRTTQMINAVNKVNADVCLIVGDLFDENPNLLPWAVEVLSRLKAKNGVYFAIGNHEYYSDVDKCIAVAEAADYQVLRDSYVDFDGLIIAAFDDETAEKQFAKPLVPLKTVLAGVDKEKPVILMHHTPRRWEEAVDYGVDLMLFGHSHGGQMWPFGMITKMIFGLPQGLTEKGKTKLYILNGIGTWGPPVRVGPDPDILLLTIS